MNTDTKQGFLSPHQYAMINEMKKAWFAWEKSGRRGTAWDFILWYEARLRGEG